ncbi:hypothetical protein 2AV2_100 [Nodularia phage vB_NpeS-2AV2]|uniref:Uncharacterized protein n=1 Tax=Nodularia phage vB_NpeS-2AV2 TaxID=1777122 RepID=A0A1L2BWZ3_9CAUD|nr:hypothetical protein HWA92_gp100 [Nodularia phage vB_NpeS-2AV2]ALY07552.1 hypothetical protein 2AV2_100 [Nodularia phage vB_NpeS-2AV2]
MTKVTRQYNKSVDDIAGLTDEQSNHVRDMQDRNVQPKVRMKQIKDYKKLNGF